MKILADKLIDALMPHVLKRIMPSVETRLNERLQPFLPSPEIYRSKPDAPFMRYSTCNFEDFLHPEFERLTDLIQHHVFYHRKLWEFVFILHHAFRSQAIGPGKRCLGFGVGSEPLPAAFAHAGSDVAATDAPIDIGQERGWTNANQLAQGLATLPQGRMSRAGFEEKVSFQACDMNAIDPDLQNYDFCWSSCAFEHLGSIDKGLDFVVNSIDTLKPGGVAVHTTEFNLTSNQETVDNAWTVLFRRRDFEDLIDRLQNLGHTVEPFVVAPNTTPVDQFVDVPPYTENPHLKLMLESFVTTSAGLVIRRNG